MKLLIFVLAGSIFISDYQKKSKLELLSHKWRQVGIKFHDKRYNPIPQTRADVYTINNDGTFQVLGPNQRLYMGQWKFNGDSTKLAFLRTDVDGLSLTDKTIDEVNPTDSIIKLTGDSFVYASVAYNADKRVWGHHYLYFVRLKN